jgi:hypothetical protein
MRTTVRLSDELLKKAKRKAASERRTLTSILEEGLRAVLADVKPARKKRIELPVSRCTGGTLPGIDLNRSAELEDRMQDL